MNNRGVRWLTGFAAASLLAVAGTHFDRVHAEASAPDDAATLATREKEDCRKNLKQIYSAIHAYQADHRDLPNWLSDLVPKYLPDATLLVCPVCQRTGKTEPAPLADPNLPSSYLFEFCPVPLGGSAPNAPNRTRREWKRRQMGLLGSVVPVVRCRFHSPVLNVSFDGNIYESPPQWEMAFTNRVRLDELSAAKLFADEDRGAKGAPKTPPEYPKRDPKARPQLIDLTGFYNARLTDSWHGGTDNTLAALPVGLKTLGGVEFDVRGIIQLSGKTHTNFPVQVTGIPVKQKCQYLHFLHAAGFGTAADEGKQIGTYVVRYATNQMRLEIPLNYGQSLRNWHKFADEPESRNLRVVWTGENGVSKREGRSLQLFLTTWTNLVPAIEIESLDLVSNMAGAAPFLIAVSAD